MYFLKEVFLNMYLMKNVNISMWDESLISSVISCYCSIVLQRIDTMKRQAKDLSR